MKKKIFSPKALTIGGLCLLCVAILVGVLYWKAAPDSSFAPEADTSVETNSEWEAPVSTPLTDGKSQQPTDEQPAATDDAQEHAADNYQVVSESPDEVVINMTPPAAKPTSEVPAPPAGKTATPDNSVPSAPAVEGECVPSTPEEKPAPSQPGKVYDPVFGWIDLATGVAEEADSTGDPDKMIGNMG